MRRRFF